jgi:hypothetical protein
VTTSLLLLKSVSRNQHQSLWTEFILNKFTFHQQATGTSSLPSSLSASQVTLLRLLLLVMPNMELSWKPDPSFLSLTTSSTVCRFTRLSTTIFALKFSLWLAANASTKPLQATCMLTMEPLKITNWVNMCGFSTTLTESPWLLQRWQIPIGHPHLTGTLTRS